MSKNMNIQSAPRAIHFRDDKDKYLNEKSSIKIDDPTVHNKRLAKEKAKLLKQKMLFASDYESKFDSKTSDK